MTVINTNIQSLVAQQSLAVNNRGLSKAMEQLSTGKRINSAADDAAGLAISNKMTAQVRGLNQAVRNANDAISMIQTTEGALNEVTNMLQRLREVAVQAVNGTNSGSDRISLDAEYDALNEEISRIADKTTWNGMQVVGSSVSYDFQVGADSGDTVSLTTQNIAASMAGVVAISTGGVSTADLASAAISDIDDALSQVNAYRGTLGALVNRLNYAADNLTNVSTNTAASRSRILDADYAQSTTELAKRQIVQQAATAMLAQANQSPSSVLSLLR